MVIHAFSSPFLSIISKSGLLVPKKMMRKQKIKQVIRWLANVEPA